MRYYFSELFHVMIFLSDCFVTGLKILIPVLLGIQILFRERLRMILYGKASFDLMILGGILFLISIGGNSIMMIYYGGEQESEMMKSILTGSQRMQFILPVLLYGLLPLVLLPAIMKNLYMAFSIVVTWYVVKFLTRADDSAFHDSVNPIREMLLKFVIFLSFYFIIVAWRHKRCKKVA